MKRATCLLLTLAFGVASACGALPEIAVGECGNRVVEAGESCDGVGQGEARCRPPGAAGQCQLDCAQRSDGTRPACPPRFGCDQNDVCREATGSYEPRGSLIPGNAHTLMTGDFDGNGRADLLSHEASGALGATKFRVHYFGRDGERSEEWIWPRLVTSLAVAPVSADSTADVVFTTNTLLGVLLGQGDRSLVSATYPTYVLPDAPVRVTGALHSKEISDSTPILVIAEIDGELNVLRPDETTVNLRPFATIPGTIADLGGDPVFGDVFADDLDDPCLDTLLAIRGTPYVHVVSICTRDEGSGEARWRKDAAVTRVTLPAGAMVERGPILADVDGNGHLDLLIGTAEQTYVAYGDGRALSPAEPWLALIVGDEMPMPMPLAAGDWSDDGVADLVLSYGLLVSERGASGEAIQYSGLDVSFGAAWTDARVADLNGNGMLDVVAASSAKLDIDFFNGTGSEFLNPFVIPTERPVDHLVVGDFDGDLIQDLTFLQLSAAEEPDEIMVAFGEPAGPPSQLVTAARASGVMQLGAIANATTDVVADLFLAYSQPNDHGSSDSAFAWLTGFDRSLMCLVQLSTFAVDGSIASVPAWSVALGAFEEPGRSDAVLVSSNLRENDLALWWMPDLRGRTGRPERLGWDLDPRLDPLHGNPDEPRIELLMAAGDLDGDSVDELILAMPDRTEEHCFLARLRILPGEPSVLESSTALQIEPPCARTGQLAIHDLDGDGAADVVLLTGTASKPRSLIALWNDGSGSFSDDAMTTLSEGDSPQAFAFYQPTSRDPLRLAYVTPTRLRVLSSAGRTFEEIENAPELELTRATGIAAGDVDGDGITDLLVADSGNVQLLRAGLR